MLTRQQKNLKKMITDLRLEYETMFDSVYIEKNRKIKDIHDVLFYLLNYEVIDEDYIKFGDYIAVYKNGIAHIYYYYDTRRTKIELYKVE